MKNQNSFKYGDLDLVWGLKITLNIEITYTLLFYNKF